LLKQAKLKAPWRITFDTNPDQCNLNCIMCEEHSIYNNQKKSGNRVMNFNFIEKVIKETVNYGLREIIPSTMGEPLLYKDFKELINMIRKYDLKLNLTTNGTFPVLGVEKWANLFMPITSDIKVSINGSKKQIAEDIMVGLNFSRQLENIKKLVKVRDKIRQKYRKNPSITFQVTFMECNLKDLENLLNLAIHLNIDRFKGHHLWITNKEIENQSLKRNPDSINRWNNTVEKLSKIAQERLMQNGNKIKLANIYKLNQKCSGSVVPKDYVCPFLGREAWIAWDGTFNVCCAPAYLRKKFGYFGNIKNKNFLDFWNGEKYNTLIKNWGKYELCRKCNMRKPSKQMVGN